MWETLKGVEEEALAAIGAAADERALEEVRVRYLGRRGALSQLLRAVGQLSPGERPRAGQEANRVKAALERALRERREGLRAAPAPPPPGLDITLPGRPVRRGRLHPITQTLEEIVAIFGALGFAAVEGPEVELDYYNFEALNIPRDHPARDMQATFYVTDDVVLRTHTSPVQVRVMERQPPPLKVVVPGKVYRCDADASHSPVFHQVEGLLVDEGVSFADLKGTLEFFVHRMFGEEVAVRFRPSFFPFTEPSAEVDMACVLCHGEGCRVCGGTGWLEILGAGMVDPAVFGFVGYDAERYTGFAFGLGVERVAMLKLGVDDIRLFFEGDLRFLGQF